MSPKGFFFLNSGRFSLLALDDLKDKSSLIRLRNLSKNYQVVQYAISRTKEMKLRYNISDRKFDKGIGAELYPTFFLAAMGKIKFFDDLFCVRQNHERRIILTNISYCIGIAIIIMSPVL